MTTWEEYRDCAERVAREVLGEPSRRLSKGRELRWGTNGSMSLDLERGFFHDHEAKIGGGVRWFLARQLTLDNPGVTEWLKTRRHITVDDRRPNGKDRTAPEPKKVVVARYDYIGANGELKFQVERLEFKKPDGSFVLTVGGKYKKTFRQRRPDPDQPGEWIYNVDGVVPILYRQAEVLEAIENGHVVFVVEGEAKVDLLWSWNIPATCCAMGSGKWLPEHSIFLEGADVLILPDNDDSGRNHEQVIGASLQDTAASVQVLDLPGLGPKGDIIDWAKAGHTADELWLLVETDARQWAPRNDDGIGQGPEGLHENPEPDTDPAVAIVPTPYRYRPPAEIPRRQWLYANHYLRGAVTGTIAPGGFTKSLRSLTEIIAMVTCRNLLGVEPGTGKLRGWYWNGEDPRDEIERRIAAICKHYTIDAETELGGLFYDSGHDMPIKIATAGRAGSVSLNGEAISQISASIADNGIDVAVFDPLISLHGVTEGDNNAMDQVVKIFGRIADQTNCAIDLDHHTRKLGPGQAEVTIDDSRGASASAFAFRSARVINRMTPKEADDLGFSRVDRRSYFRIDKPKANYTAPEDAAWCHVVPVHIANGDIVGVPEPWTYPDAFADVSTADINWIRTLIISGGEYRTSPQAKNWIGVPLAERLKLNLDSKSDKAKIRRVLETWLKNGVLATEDRKDENRKNKQYVILGTWKPDDTTTRPDTDTEP